MSSSTSTKSHWIEVLETMIRNLHDGRGDDCIDPLEDLVKEMKETAIVVVYKKYKTNNSELEEIKTKDKWPEGMYKRNHELSD